jgi:hypothetical protein
MYIAQCTAPCPIGTYNDVEGRQTPADCKVCTYVYIHISMYIYVHVIMYVYMFIYV